MSAEDTKTENEHPSLIHEYRARGWHFFYCEDTRQIWAHDRGAGRERVCMIHNILQPHNWGKAIAEMLNGRLPQ